MWTQTRIALIALLLGIAVAYGAGITGSVSPQIGGGISEFNGGISTNSGFTGVAPVNCGTGIIDLTTGCTQPMFGVM